VIYRLPDKIKRMGTICRSVFRFAVVCSFLSVLSAQDSRPFYLGFTPFPPDLTSEAVDEVYRFISDHGDLVAHHFDSGVPWPEAYRNESYSTHLNQDWTYRRSRIQPGRAVYVSITPLNFERNGPAAYWGETDNMENPAPWNDYPLNHPSVKQAFLNYARKVVDFFQPLYLAIGIESNILISKAPELWDGYLELNRHVYTQLKLEHPKLKIFPTVQYEHLRGIEDESKGKRSLQEQGVRELMRHSDLLALSTYHFGVRHNPVREDFFESALSFGKPVAIAETGAFSRNITISGTEFEGSERDQRDFLNLLLQKGKTHLFPFIINFIAIDYDRMLPKLPEDIREISKVWVSTGLADAAGRGKAALELWDSYLRLPRSPRSPAGLKSRIQF